MNITNSKPQVVSNPSKEIFNSLEKVNSHETSELVIALCGPIGSPIHQVAECLKVVLNEDFAFKKCEILRLSEIITEHSPGISETLNGFERIRKLIDGGNKLRLDHGNSILTEIAISKIAEDRHNYKKETKSEHFAVRRVCHIIDSIKNQEELDILKAVYRDMLYFIGVFSPLPVREKCLQKKDMTTANIYELIDRDSGEEIDSGQTVRNTFPEADFFLRIDADTDTQISRKVKRFLHLILGTKILTPSNSETAMYAAASAASNSACLSRQVGAAITNESGDVISSGWNDVPQAFGNLYCSAPYSESSNDKDKRCWNLDGGTCFNDVEKQGLAKILAESLASEGLINIAHVEVVAQKLNKHSKLKGLIEFSRSIHAEMHAILLAGEHSNQSLKKGKLFCTTYPCHSCARHIIASGISEVYYIEPYRKSLAIKLHNDAITEDESDKSKVRILPYEGVAPSRFLSLFRAKPDSRKINGKMCKVDPKIAIPKSNKTLEALPTLEGIVVKALQAKNLLPGKND